MTKGEDTRSIILKQALAMASTLGLGGLSIGELAKNVGLSKSGLFAHFSSKENLQLQVLQVATERYVEMVVAPALRKPRGEPRVRSLFENVLAWTGADFLPGGCLFVTAATEFDDQPGQVRDYLVGAQKDWLGTIAMAAKIASDEGHFRSDLDYELFAREFQSIFLSHHYYKKLLNDPKAEEQSRTMFEQLVERSRKR
ncbi:MAG: TetR/AcrR family transcriptional regulator [Blastocatellia bacterium]|nr:TetR/AcrR family transcriptional regulator [Blastocatellia bacterium]